MISCSHAGENILNVKGQQDIIEAQRKEIDAQRKEIGELKARVEEKATPLQPQRPIPQLKAVSYTPQFFRSETVGGPGGRPFTDGQPERARLTGIRIRAADRIDSIQMIYDNVPSEKHGKDGGTLTEITFEPDEYILSISGRAAKLVDKLTLQTIKASSVRISGGAGNAVARRRDVRLNLTRACL
jgi:hypothetical protein